MFTIFYFSILQVEMTKLTWKEATLNHIKALIVDSSKPFDSKNVNVFSIKQLLQTKIDHIIIETRSRTKYPERTLDKTLRELRDFGVIRHRADHGARVYEYVPNSDNEELIYKNKRSNGHIRVTKCLDRFGINYEEEKTFHDLKHISFLRLDIYCVILGRQLAIEYDGSQHQRSVEVWGGDPALEDCQQRDNIKNSYCKQKGITLLRISHEIKNIEAYVIDFIYQIIIEYVARCLLVVFIYLYRKAAFLGLYKY